MANGLRCELRNISFYGGGRRVMETMMWIEETVYVYMHMDYYFQPAMAAGEMIDGRYRVER